MKILRQSTEQIIKFGPMVDVGDGATLEVGLATAMDNATTGLRVSKDGGNYADRNSATVPAYDAMGDYNVTLSTTDTNTVGQLRVIFEEAATCLPHWEDYLVVDAGWYDAVTGAVLQEVNTTEVGGTTQTANDMSGDIDTILLDTGELQTASAAGQYDTATGFATPTNITAATGITVATMGASTIDAASIAVGAIEADAFAAGAIDAAAIATDAIGAAELAADAVTEIQSGLATASALATVDANIDTMVAGIFVFSAQTGTLSTTQATTDITGVTTDQMIGRLITWTSGIVEREQTAITDFDPTGGLITFELMTLAPGNGDTGKIT